MTDIFCIKIYYNNIINKLLLFNLNIFTETCTEKLIQKYEVIRTP